MTIGNKMEVGSAMSESQTETKSTTESATKSKPGRLPVDDVRSLIDAC